ncbi:hypothetical protein DSO57_1006761 [Entomophthora muscae]|uniref:Uncharacterized protein n=1 Tax=Entomophthora muscae TaxID=34485 RepID=A0ACC2S9L4_9FUNG|nr:hypothetical protein DSO57_1006761 [Entomophthora muscae]
MHKDTGGGKKKSLGKHGAAKAPYVKPGLEAVFPDAWDNNQASVDQSKGEFPINDNKIIAADVAVGPGSETDNPNWL